MRPSGFLIWLAALLLGGAAVAQVGYLNRQTGQIQYANQNWNTVIQGVSPDYLPITNWQIALGRPLTDEDEASVAETINRAAPHFVWVALPGVRMERWIIGNQARYKRGVFLAVGDAFVLLTGRRQFAPLWMQRLGMTWMCMYTEDRTKQLATQGERARLHAYILGCRRPKCVESQ